MIAFLLGGSALAYLGYRYFFPAGPSAAQVAATDLKIAAMTPALGDIITVGTDGVDSVASETSLGTGGTGLTLSAADQASMNLIPKGGTMDLLVTKIGLVAPGGSGVGQAVTIGVVVQPVLSVRFPVGALNSMVKRIVRNGAIVFSQP